MIFLDTETVGFTGPIVLIQYAYDNGPVKFHYVWDEPVKETLRLIERICNDPGGVCAFNFSYDWFHINRLFNVLNKSEDKGQPPNIDEFAANNKASSTRYCLRPKTALDLFLIARKSKWQVLMRQSPRDDIRIKRVPSELAQPIAELLQKKVPLSAIFFHYRSHSYEWQVEPIVDEPGLSNVVLRFGPSSGLKPLVAELFKVDTAEFPIPNWLKFEEKLYNPYSLNWLPYLEPYRRYWHTGKARTYAENDIIYLQKLYEYFDSPKGDIDSELAACVGAVRWKGYAVDLDAIVERLHDKTEIIKAAPCNVNASIQVQQYLKAGATALERVAITNSTKETLDEVSKWGSDAGRRAKEIKRIRSAYKECDMLSKLIETGRFCPDFKVIGTRSGRMSGGGDARSKGGSINPQGIQRSGNFRQLFRLADETENLSGGDFNNFEVCIAHAWSRDENLRRDTESGKSFHGVFGSYLYDISYDEVYSDKGGPDSRYDRSKKSAFSILYGAMAHRVATTTGESETKAQSAIDELARRYPDYFNIRENISRDFCSMQQPGGIGTPVVWHEPADFAESLLGFKRYFTLENGICKACFELAQDYAGLPKVFGDIKRRSKVQTKVGALQSALYAAAFNVQARNMRAAMNHVIQSTGAEICKALQAAIWQIQPYGIHPWKVRPMNVHDEVMVAHEDGMILTDLVNSVIEHYKDVVPLLSLTWKSNMKDWSEK